MLLLYNSPVSAFQWRIEPSILTLNNICLLLLKIGGLHLLKKIIRFFHYILVLPNACRRGLLGTSRSSQSLIYDTQLAFEKIYPDRLYANFPNVNYYTKWLLYLEKRIYITSSHVKYFNWSIWIAFNIIFSIRNIYFLLNNYLRQLNYHQNQT